MSSRAIVGALVALLGVGVLVRCTPPGPGPGPGPGDDGGNPTDGGPDDGGLGDGGPGDGGLGDGGAGDAGTVDPRMANWQWISVPGSKCGSGSTTGFAINYAPSASGDLFIFLQGGGACWNTGTCRPSLVQWGPVCYYNSGALGCIANVAGGQQPTAVHVWESNPFPPDGGGALPGELGALMGNRPFARELTDNPFRDATFVYIPYCTGDLHAGTTSRQYSVQRDLIGTPTPVTQYFVGGTNMDLFLTKLKTLVPNANRVWLTGVSGGAFGATLNYERVTTAFASAQVHLLADSSPFIETNHWAEWRDTWAIPMPAGCADCDGGMPQMMEHLAVTYPDRRLGLLSYDHDHVISWFFYGGTGPDQVLNPPTSGFVANLAALQGRYEAHSNTKYFVLPGTDHVQWPAYGSLQADGGYTASPTTPDGGLSLRKFIDDWANGDPGWRSAK